MYHGSFKDHSLSTPGWLYALWAPTQALFMCLALGYIKLKVLGGPQGHRLGREGGATSFDKQCRNLPRPPNIPPLRALWSLLDGIWSVLIGGCWWRV